MKGVWEEHWANLFAGSDWFQTFLKPTGRPGQSFKETMKRAPGIGTGSIRFFYFHPAVSVVGLGAKWDVDVSSPLSLVPVDV